MSKRKYKCLAQQEFVNGVYKLIPIRDEDKYAIMQWRNDQIDILRQKEILTKIQQDWYFENVVAKLFEQEQPSQLLFSFLENDQLIGYGGLVHIDWESGNAEISFITETKRNKEAAQLVNDWCQYLKILKKIADTELNLVKIYTYSYDIRPLLFDALLQSDFIEEGRLKNHIKINNETKDVLIHSFFLSPIYFRKTTEKDTDKYFEWTNDEDVRKNSFNTNTIEYQNHVDWFAKKLLNNKCFFYFFLDQNQNAIGQVRIEIDNAETVIGISIDKEFRGKSLSSKMIKISSNNFIKNVADKTITAYIKKENIASINSFIKSGYSNKEQIIIDGTESYKLFFNDKRNIE